MMKETNPYVCIAMLLGLLLLFNINLVMLALKKQIKIVPYVMHSFFVSWIVVMIQSWENANVTKDITKKQINLNVFFA